MPALSAKATRLASISGRDGKYELPSINPGWRARAAGSSVSRLFQSYRSYALDPRGTGACGFVHDSSRWKNGQRRNIPPGDGSAEMTACSTPSARNDDETWSAPGPLPMTSAG